MDRLPEALEHPFWTAALEQTGGYQELPPAVVVDVGLIDDRGWAVVEFNPVFCAGLLGADPAAVLPVLARACRPRDHLGADERWVIERT